jgi:REP element-mobilizing transposase RayT
MSNDRYRNTYIDGCSHLCTASIWEFIPFFLDERMCRLVIGAWNRYRKRFSVAFEGFVIMPEHIHLLIRGKGEDVRKFMQYSLSQVSRDIRLVLETDARRGNQRAAERLGIICSRANGASLAKVWKERFRCVALDKEDAVLEKLNYMHNNPVKRELVERPEDWKWSSAGFYNGGTCVVMIDSVFGCGN